MDRFAKHNLKIKYYLRYGDDFIILADGKEKMELIKAEVSDFLATRLRLEINRRNDIIIKADEGVKFLGVLITPERITLSPRNNRRWRRRLDLNNLASYSGLIRQFEPERISELNYSISDIIDNQYG